MKYALKIEPTIIFDKEDGETFEEAETRFLNICSAEGLNVVVCKSSVYAKDENVMIPEMEIKEIIGDKYEEVRS